MTKWLNINIQIVIILKKNGVCDASIENAEALYKQGYRKVEQGEWVMQEKETPISPEAVCSNCGREVVYQIVDNKWEFENYCPHCGLKMKGE